MTNTEPKILLRRVVSHFALWFIVVCLTIYILNLGAPIIIPFVIATFVWYLINAMARGFGRFKLPRVLCFTLAILFLAMGVWDIFELISRNVTNVAKAAPIYQQHFHEMVPKIFTWLNLEYQPTIQELMNYLNISALIATIVRTVSGIAGKTVVVMFYTGFLLYEQKYFNTKITGMFADKKLEKSVRQILHNIDIKVQRYIWVKTFVSTLAGGLTFLILQAWHVDFAAFWGAITFLLNFIPYVGSLLSILLPSLIALVQFSDQAEFMSSFLFVLISLGILHGIIGHALDPFLMGKNLNLSPIFIITSLAMWEMIWGVPGMFLAIPILAMIVITLSQFPATRPLAVLLSKTGEIEEDDDVEEKTTPIKHKKA
jgi:AI-2 transport protein TqsA